MTSTTLSGMESHSMNITTFSESIYLHEEGQHPYRTKATRFKYNYF